MQGGSTASTGCAAGCPAGGMRLPADGVRRGAGAPGGKSAQPHGRMGLLAQAGLRSTVGGLQVRQFHKGRQEEQAKQAALQSSQPAATPGDRARHSCCAAGTGQRRNARASLSSKIDPTSRSSLQRTWHRVSVRDSDSESAGVQHLPPAANGQQSAVSAVSL